MQVGEVELLRRSPEVAVAIHVSLDDAIDRGEHGIPTDVELAIVDQQGLVEVLLHNGCPVAVLGAELLNEIPDLIEGVGHLDAGASVGVLARLDDPDVGILLLLELLVRPSELLVLRVVVVGRLDVESERDGDLEGIDTHCLVVCAHVEEERLLVRQVVVVIQPVVDQCGHVS